MDEILNKILTKINLMKGVNFFNYSMNTLRRRLRHRMILLGINDIYEYYEYFLENCEEEIEKLIDLFLINTTEFFRDPVYFYFFEILAKNLIKSGLEYLKIIDIACSTGEESYSIGIILNELKEKNKNFDYTIEAIDIDKKAIESAEKGVYTETSINNLPYKFIKKYFLKNSNNNTFIIKKDYFLNKINFIQKNILNEDNLHFQGTFKYNFIFFRNILIYLKKDIRKRILSKLLEISDNTSYLILGHNEYIEKEFEKIFIPVSEKIRIFKREI